MARLLRQASYLLASVLILIPSLEATPQLWQPRRTPPSSVINVSIGNRINTNAELDDRGTSIHNFGINLSHWNGNFTFAKNGSEIQVTRGDNGITNIRIIFNSNSTAQPTATNPFASNSTQPSNRRRKRATGFPSLPTIPIPTLNGSHAFLDGSFFPLPSAISNLSSTANNTCSLLQPWQFLQSFLDRRLPMTALDTVVSFLSGLHNSTGKRLVDTGINSLGETTDFVSGIVNWALDLARDQTSAGIQNVVQTFKGLTQTGQSCVGQVPDDAARQVVSKATGCVRERWNEAEQIVNQFLSVVSDTEEAYGGWLRALEGCNASNFQGMSETAQNAAQRECYVKAIINSLGKMIDIPVRWGNLAVFTSNAVTGFQTQVGLCVAGVGAEIASVSADIGVRIVLCQVF